LGLPAGIRQALGRRLRLLGRDALELLQLCAIAGREFAYETLMLLAERDDATTLQLLEEGLAARVVEEMEQPGWYRFTHALMHETVLSALSATRRMRLHVRVGEALERHWGEHTGDNASRLAEHFGAAAPLGRAYGEKGRWYARLAGDQARRQFAWSEAVRWYEAALAGQDDPDPELLAARFNSQLNVSHFFGGVRAVDLFQPTLAAYREHGDELGAARILANIPDVWAWWDGIPALLRAAIAAADETQDVQLRTTLRVKLVAGLAGSGGPEAIAEIERCESQVLELVTDSTSPLLDHIAAARAARAGDMIAASELLEEAARGYLASNRPILAAYVLSDASGHALAGGHLARAQRLAELLDETSTAYRWVTGSDSALQARLMDSLFKRPSESFTIIGAGGLPWPLWWDVVAGRPDEAVAALAPLALFDFQSPGVTIIVAGHRAAARHLGGRASVAEWELWAKLWRDGVGINNPMHRTTSFALASLVLPELGDDELCREVYDEVHDWKNRAGHIAGIGVDAGRGRLALRLGLVDEARQAFEEGLQWSERERCPVEAGRNLYGLGLVAQQSSEFAGALAQFEKASALFEAHGALLFYREANGRAGEVRAVLAKGRHRYPDGLSAREVEVLRFVAAGLTNEAVAEQLHISPHTVIRHMTNIFQKASLRNRAEAAAYAQRHGLVD
jgi:DNA-binding CsgD family transcriptional regulator